MHRALRYHPPSAVYPLLLLALGEVAEWHLSSELALAPRQGEFIWFDMWCAAHIFTGAVLLNQEPDSFSGTHKDPVVQELPLVKEGGPTFQSLRKSSL